MVVRVTGLNVVAIYGVDLDASLRFYTEMLGFRPGKTLGPGRLLEGGGGAGRVTIYLEGGRELRHCDGATHTGVSLCLDVAGGLREACRALEAAGVRITTPLEEYGAEFAMFRVADPSGNIVEFAGKP